MGILSKVMAALGRVASREAVPGKVARSAKGAASEPICLEPAPFEQFREYRQPFARYGDPARP